jgi:hypothetical protein
VNFLSSARFNSQSGVIPHKNPEVSWDFTLHFLYLWKPACSRVVYCSISLGNDEEYGTRQHESCREEKLFVLLPIAGILGVGGSRDRTRDEVSYEGCTEKRVLRNFRDLAVFAGQPACSSSPLKYRIWLWEVAKCNALSQVQFSSSNVILVINNGACCRMFPSPNLLFNVWYTVSSQVCCLKMCRLPPSTSLLYLLAHALRISASF